MGEREERGASERARRWGKESVGGGAWGELSGRGEKLRERAECNASGEAPGVGRGTSEGAGRDERGGRPGRACGGGGERGEEERGERERGGGAEGGGTMSGGESVEKRRARWSRRWGRERERSGV